MKNGRDIPGTAPVIVPPQQYAVEYVDSYAFESGQGYWPQLLVTYTISAPTNVQATKGTLDDKIEISWSPTGATEYDVYYNTVNDSGTATLLDTTSASSYDHLVDFNFNPTYNSTFARPGGAYYYWVQACIDYGNSEFSDSDKGQGGGKTKLNEVINIKSD